MCTYSNGRIHIPRNVGRIAIVAGLTIRAPDGSGNIGGDLDESEDDE